MNPGQKLALTLFLAMLPVLIWMIYEAKQELKKSQKNDTRTNTRY